jgi:hypothetical protein
MQLATKHYVDTHSANVGGHVTANQGAGVDGTGALAPLPEVGLSTTGGVTSFLCQEDHKAGVYDPRCPRYGGIYGTIPQQVAAANALFNQVACDAQAGLITQAEIRYPQGTFYWDNAQLPPGAWVHGVPNSIGGTTIQNAYNGRQVAIAPPSMSATCNGTTVTVGGANTKVSNLTFHGCDTGSCIGAPSGLSTFTVYSLPGVLIDYGLDMQSSGGMVENVYTWHFSGFGLRASGQDTKVYHCRGFGDNGAYLNPSYNGAGDNTGPFGTGWHGAHEFFGQDIVVDGDEVYGWFDSPTTGTYLHVADILVGGGIAYFDHLWPQLGLVGIVSPFALGTNVLVVHAKVDFSRTYGVWSDSPGFQLRDSQIDGACTAGNAATINTSGPFAGTCESLFTASPGADITNVLSYNNNGFGPSFKTADFLIAFGVQHNLTGNYELVNTGSTYGQNINWEPHNTGIVGITAASPNIDLVQWINPTDSVAATYTSFNHVMQNQDFYFQGGNTNVTINNNPPYIVLCAGTNVSLGSVRGFMHFRATAGDAFGLPGHVTQVCGV